MITLLLGFVGVWLLTLLYLRHLWASGPQPEATPGPAEPAVGATPSMGWDIAANAKK